MAPSCSVRSGQPRTAPGPIVRPGRAVGQMRRRVAQMFGELYAQLTKPPLLRPHFSPFNVELPQGQMGRFDGREQGTGDMLAPARRQSEAWASQAGRACASVRPTLLRLSWRLPLSGYDFPQFVFNALNLCLEISVAAIIRCICEIECGILSVPKFARFGMNMSLVQKPFSAIATSLCRRPQILNGRTHPASCGHVLLPNGHVGSAVGSGCIAVDRSTQHSLRVMKLPAICRGEGLDTAKALTTAG